MIKNKKILVTGVTGTVAAPIARYLAKNNQVWGAARFTSPESRAKVEREGITPCVMDLESGDVSQLPTDVDYVLHFAFMRGTAEDFDRAILVNGEGVGLVLKHCLPKAALVISSHAIYAPNPDPTFECKESSELGRSFAPWGPTSPVTKVAEEAVARFSARAFQIPVTIARLNTVYGGPGHLISMHIQQLLAGETVMVPNDPNNHRPIHIDDMCEQIEPLLGAASIPATTVNWAGDEVVSTQYWCRELAKLLNCQVRVEKFSLPGTQLSHIADIEKCKSITGPCRVKFLDGLARLCGEYKNH